MIKDILVEDVVFLLEESKDLIDTLEYREEISSHIMSRYNCDGTFTYSTFEARQSLINYTECHSDLLAYVVDSFYKEYDMSIGGNFFNKPELFQVQVLIYIIDMLFYTDSELSEWVYSETPLSSGDRERYKKLVDRFIKEISNDEFDLTEFLIGY